MANVAASASSQDSGSTGGSDAALKAAWAGGLSHNRKETVYPGRESRFRSLWNLVSRRRTGQSSTQSMTNSRQINRFLEFIEDVLPKLDKEKGDTDH